MNVKEYDIPHLLGGCIRKKIIGFFTCAKNDTLVIFRQIRKWQRGNVKELSRQIYDRLDQVKFRTRVALTTAGVGDDGFVARRHRPTAARSLQTAIFLAVFSDGQRSPLKSVCLERFCCPLRKNSDTEEKRCPEEKISTGLTTFPNTACPL